MALGVLMPQTARPKSRDHRACSQPAWQRTSTLPSPPSRIDRLGSRSSWAGQRAIQPPPALRPPRALAMDQRSWRTSPVIPFESRTGGVRLPIEPSLDFRPVEVEGGR